MVWETRGSLLFQGRYLNHTPDGIDYNTKNGHVQFWGKSIIELAGYRYGRLDVHIMGMSDKAKLIESLEEQGFRNTNNSSYDIITVPLLSTNLLAQLELLLTTSAPFIEQLKEISKLIINTVQSAIPKEVLEGPVLEFKKAWVSTDEKTSNSKGPGFYESSLRINDEDNSSYSRPNYDN